MTTVLQHMLGAGEAVPPAVDRIQDFFESSAIWVRFGRNDPASGCRDAAHKRVRLGHIGIELHDELKSFVGVFRDGEGRQQYFLAHCRGDRRLVLERVRQALGATELPARLDADQAASLGLAYGLVNPFGLFGREGPLLSFDIVQVFDEEVLEDCGLPGTMMTNAGDLTWAVEFKPMELLAALPRCRVARIAEPDPANPARRWGKRPAFKLGIITGNAPESGMALWSKINSTVRRSLGEDFMGDISLPEIMVCSLPILGLTMELEHRHDMVCPSLVATAESLARGGMTTLAIACNTSQYFIPGLREHLGDEVEIVSIPEIVAEELGTQRDEEIAIVGIRYVTDLSSGWSGYAKSLEGYKIEELSPELSAKLDDLAYLVKKQGPTRMAYRSLRKLINRNIRSRRVLLALTELSLLLQFEKKEPSVKHVLIDPLELYAQALAQRYLGLRRNQ